MSRRAVILVLDGVGIGAAADAAAYGDAGSDTLGNLAHAMGGLDLPNLERAGLGCIKPILGIPATPSPTAAWGLCCPASPGKDSTTGHWEIAGVHLERPFPTYPDGFPGELIAQFARDTGRGVIGNIAGSGTEIMHRFGPEHERTGAWILYTSADSVLQLAANEEIIPVAVLYDACRRARRMLTPPHDVSRVIARPFVGRAGAYVRTERRRDFALEPPVPTLLDAVANAGLPVRGIGKVDDLFAGRSISAEHTRNNAEGIQAIRRQLAENVGGLVFANLVDFDTRWGHRNDVPGFYEGLQQFDRELPALVNALHEDDLLFITADHGNDPTTRSTDHSRENVPLLVCGRPVKPQGLGARSTLADIGSTIAEWLALDYAGRGSSFLDRVVAA